MQFTKAANLQPSSRPWAANSVQHPPAQEDAPLVEGHAGAGGHLGLSRRLQRAVAVALTFPHLSPPLQLCTGGRGGGRAAAAVPTGGDGGPSKRLPCLGSTESRSRGQLAAAGPAGAGRIAALFEVLGAEMVGSSCCWSCRSAWQEQGWAAQGVDWRQVEVVSGQLVGAGQGLQAS